jgi:predicted nucleotidyltransferase component of viral defense system
MNSSGPDYKNLYKLQDRIFQVVSGHLGDFYLTGGTAMGRFYMDHRYSDDLDFFVNNHPGFQAQTQKIFNILQRNFDLDESGYVDAEEYKRIWINDKVRMKVELVNDIAERWGITIIVGQIPVDNPGNILANKLTALLSRDEAKDVFDIVTLANSYSFNWKDVFRKAARKQIINEPDILMRLTTFPVEWLKEVRWKKEEIEIARFKTTLDRIADDFLFARDNSLGAGKMPITEAQPRCGSTI